MANYTKHLDDLKDVLRVYYEENGEIVEIGTDIEVNPYYTVDYNTKTVSVFNLDDFTPKIDYTSTDAQNNVELDLNAIGAVDINSVMNNGLPTGYTIRDGKIIVDSVEAGDSISVNYDLERIKIGALEYEDGDKTKNPILYGMRIRNSQGENVFTTDDKGDIHMTGTVNARAGNFSGNVLVGNEEDKYIILSTELEDEPVIASSDYVNNRNQGWVINGSGDAIFNNITARGAIKTAVFEYEEIEAVGGAFLFRPSSTIKNAWIENPIEETITAVDSEGFRVWTLPENTVLPFTITVFSSDLEDSMDVKITAAFNYFTFNGQNYTLLYNGPRELGYFVSYLSTLSTDILFKSTGSDLIVEVEKPQFKKGDWVKLDNFKDGDATTATGLAAIYEIDQITYEEDGETYVESPNQLILKGAAEYYFDNPEDLIGGALINLGQEKDPEDPTKKLDNYGIGINSGDGDILLPPRAISLFESTINPEANPKVSFDYTGILGTLPEIKDGVLPLDVDEDIYENMGGTQGIYTNNMYIGDANQYVAFYEESNEKVLDIAAGSISVGMGNYDPLYLIGDQYGVALYRGDKAESTSGIVTNNLFINDESLQLRSGQNSYFSINYETDSTIKEVAEIGIGARAGSSITFNESTIEGTELGPVIDSLAEEEEFDVSFTFEDYFLGSSTRSILKRLTVDNSGTSFPDIENISYEVKTNPYFANEGYIFTKIKITFKKGESKGISTTNNYITFGESQNLYNTNIVIKYGLLYDGNKTFTLYNDCTLNTNRPSSQISFDGCSYSLVNAYYSKVVPAPSLVYGGQKTSDVGQFSSSLGANLIAQGYSQTVIGKFNEKDENNEYAFLVGGGDATRKNIFGIDWNGDLLMGYGSKIEMGIEPGYQSKYINFKDDQFVSNNVSSKSDDGYVTNLSISSDNKNLKLMTANDKWSTSSTIWDVDMTKVAGIFNKTSTYATWSDKAAGSSVGTLVTLATFNLPANSTYLILMKNGNAKGGAVSCNVQGYLSQGTAAIELDGAARSLDTGGNVAIGYYYIRTTTACTVIIRTYTYDTTVTNFNGNAVAIPIV